jgi:phosphoglycerate dehydrogenase-like enzyme
MRPPLVLVTSPEFQRGEPVFASAGDLECVEAPEDEAGLVEAIARRQARHVVIGSVPYGDRLYAALPRGGVIARYGVGHDTVDKPKATRAALLCTNTPDVLQQSVAELTILMLLAAARHICQADATMRQGTWTPRQGLEVEGKTLALVGCGAIGQAVARIASTGLRMRVLGYARRPAAVAGKDEHFVSVSDDFAAVVREADFVSLHIPGGPDNARFIDRARLALMPGRAWLINTARGAVVDEAALFDALAAGRLAGAALDVFAREPYQPADPGRDLRTLPQVILLPHVGSNTTEANARMATRALRNIRLAEAGEHDGMDLLNPDVLTSGGGAGA